MSRYLYSYYNMYGHIGFWLIVLTLAICVYALIKDFSRRKARNRQLEAEMEADIDLPPVEAVDAVVAAKDVTMEKDRRTHWLVYNVTFITDGGEKTTHPVTEEKYEALYIGQKGTLATVRGEFFDFG